MSETKHTFCRICEAACGLSAEIENGEIKRLWPDKQHVASRGFACIKGIKQQKIYESPDRLREPLRREGKDFQATSWDEANASIGAKLRQLIKDHGPDSIGLYLGTAAGFSLPHAFVAAGFLQGLGSKQLYGPATQDCANKFHVAEQIYGYPFIQPFPDVDRCDCMILVGGNPAISKMSFLQLPNAAERIRAIESRGGKVFVVDPRRTETAKAVGEHVFIRPDSDLFFYLSFLHELLAQEGVKRDVLAAHARGFDAVAALARDWPAERTAEVTGIAPETLRKMVSAYADTPRAALYCSTGVNMGSQGSLAFWLQECINLAAGKLDRPGGTLVGRGIIDLPRWGKKFGFLTRKDRTRVGGLRSVNDCFPGGVLADEILTPGRGQIRALIVTGGNPLITMANAERLREAFESLELLVVIDIQRSETAELAHYVLPATAPFERPDALFIFPLFLGIQAEPYVQATERLIPPPGQAREEPRIFHDLAKACGKPLFASRAAQWAFGRKTESILSAILRFGGQGSFAKLVREHPHGRRRPDNSGHNFLGKRVLTENGRVQLDVPHFLEAAKALPTQYARRLKNKDELLLITRRAVRTHNSWTHNLAEFTTALQGRNFLTMHPEDAAARDLDDGAAVDVRSATGELRLPVKLDSDLMPGVVALPHGWGHQAARGQSVACKTAGVNVNILAADGPDGIEAHSGMAHLTGIPVEVSAASGPVDEKFWSGLPNSSS